MMKQESWDLVIKPNQSWIDLKFRELWRYRDLVFLFVRRDFVAQYKQTILGPLWHVIQPLMTSFIFIIIFGKIAKLGTDGSPSILFYLSGIICWNYFSTSLLSTSTTFTQNAYIFGKIYFPRLVVPVAVIFSSMIRFGIQLILFFGVFIAYKFFVDGTITVAPNSYILLLPVVVFLMGLIGMGIGLIVSSVTTKYKDVAVFVGSAVQLLIYLSPVVYPSMIWQKYQWVMEWNPLTYLIESFRYMVMGTGHISFSGLAFSACFALIVFLFGAMVFNRAERSFMDTV